MLANHFVIEDILKKWGNMQELEKEFEKFSKRYSEDKELQALYKKFKKCQKDKTRLTEIKKELEKLYIKRVMTESAGDADSLPYASRRYF